MSAHDVRCAIRRVVPADVATLIDLCVEHAAFERADGPVTATPERLRAALFGPTPRLHAWIAEQDDGVRDSAAHESGSRDDIARIDGSIVGYATATIDYATWTGAQYLHMDCLFVRQAWRGKGLGARLLDAVSAFARELGYTQLQWQTPAWNDAAARFYERMGARSTAKRRFVRVIAASPHAIVL